MVLEASAAGLAAVQPRLRRFLEGGGVAPRAVDRVEVTVEEVVMNVAMHAFDAASLHVVALRAAPRGAGCCALVFEDAGRHFDPTAPAQPEPARGLAEAPAGGFGLVVLRRLSSDIAYKWLPVGLNHLRVVLAPPS